MLLALVALILCFFFSSRRRHTRFDCDWSSDVCSSDLGEYRGLQFSYDDAFAQLGLGGLLQYHQIVELCAEGVTRYDLGTEMDYKRRWAEDVIEIGRAHV